MDSNLDDLVQNFRYVDIPYGTEFITANPELSSVQCFIYNPLRILICIECKIAIAPDLLVGHRRSRHRDRLVTQPFVNTLAETYNLHRLDFFENTPNTPVPGIYWEKGYKCGINDCTAASTSFQRMKRHMSAVHQVVRTPPPTSLVQIIFDSNSRRYPVTVSPSLLPSSSSNSPTQSLNPVQILLKQYHDASNATQLLAAPDDPALLNPFLAKYRWLNILKGLPSTKVRDWVCFPQARDRKFIFKELEEAVNEYYQKICREMESPDNDSHTTTLRWINSTKE